MKNKEVKIELDLFDICLTCFGRGKLKAMQTMMTYDAGPIRGPDTTVKCPDCKGTGLKRRIKNESL